LIKNSRILICPIDWGLGHSSRDVYLINRLLERNYEMFIGGEGDSLKFLQNEFPDLTFIYLPSFQIRFSNKYPAWLMITLFLPQIFTWIYREKKILHKVIREYEIDLVISDTRYGLRSSLIPSVIITHQISFKLPLLLKSLQHLVYRINLAAINRFSQCWIPDFPGIPNLSGDLSHKYKLPGNALYIGPLSRFNIDNNNHVSKEEFDVAVILSGPEPQRTIFEKIVIAQLIHNNIKSIIICGKPGENIPENHTATCKRISCLQGYELLSVLKSSKYIICRSGYSTIMDLVTLKKTALLVPTPGQTEQEYLARYLEKHNLFLYSKQKDFNIENAMIRLDKFMPDMTFGERYDLLDKAIQGLPLLIKKSCRG